MKAVLLAILLWVPQASAPGRFALEGRVVRTGTEDPVPAATVVVAKVNGAIDDYRTGLTDVSGRFAFSDLSSGSYRIYAARTGYLQAEFGVRPGVTRIGPPVQITLDDKHPRSVITLPMTPFGVVAGTVRSSDGTPVSGAWVRVLRSRYRDGERQLDAVAWAQTNDLGQYRVFDLAPGPYFVSATVEQPRISGNSYVTPASPIQISESDRGYRLQVTTPAEKALAAGEIRAGAFDNRFFFPVYYPNTRNAADAETVQVRSGATVTLADIVVAPTPAVHVRGRVINGTTGQGAPNVTVILPLVRSVQTGSTGEFDIPGVPSGRYELWCSSFPDALKGFARIDVADRDLEKLTLVVMPGMKVNGQLTIDGRVPGAITTPIFVQLVSPRGSPGTSGIAVQPDGSFAIPNVGSGIYRFRALGQKFYVKAARYGGATDILNAPMQLEFESNPRLITVDISLNTGTIEAQVFERNQQPAPRSFVALVPDAPRRDRSELYLIATTDDAGKVQMEGIAPGDYRIFASLDIDAGAWQDPAVLAEYERFGTPVHIVEKGKQTLTLRVLPSQP